ncbi:MAG TPA: LysR family transcriptional regulator [Burkholderiaceae bacterium]|jgi:DNA-binding transcriptional LysR family regulator|nr:LysR family transcriptional regulator [Burkholderiaceae bacterium]
MDNLSGILAFVRAAEARNFTKAARQLGMTPSGVSKAISRLENQFKVRLLHRTSRSVTMTPEGAGFYERCRTIIADLEDAELLLSQARGEPHGVLRITLPLSIGRLHLARVLPEFVQRYPELKVEAVFTDRLVDLIEEGFDVAVRLGKPPDSRVVARQIATGTVTTCASPAYLKRHGTPRTPEDLAQHNCVRFAVPSTGRTADWRFQRDGKRFSVAVSGNLVLDHAEALVEAALAGTALIQVSSYVTAAPIRRGALKAVLTRFQVDGPAVWAMYPQNRHLTPRVRALVDFLVQWGQQNRF